MEKTLDFGILACSEWCSKPFSSQIPHHLLRCHSCIHTPFKVSNSFEGVTFIVMVWWLRGRMRNRRTYHFSTEILPFLSTWKCQNKMTWNAFQRSASMFADIPTENTRLLFGSQIQTMFSNLMLSSKNYCKSVLPFSGGRAHCTTWALVFR